MTQTLQVLADESVAAKKEFRRWQQAVKKAVDRAREEWIKKLAVQWEAAVRMGRPRSGSALGAAASPSCWVQTHHAKRSEEGGWGAHSGPRGDVAEVASALHQDTESAE